jgi:hypothetical protein
MQPRRLPNFFIVGAPKAGTTSLYHYLDQHPQIYMSPIKEPNYFSKEIRPEHFSDEFQQMVSRDLEALEQYMAGPMIEKRPGGIIQDWDRYLKLFSGVQNQTAVGEASVCYLWSASAPANIRAQIPDARIIMTLRNPSDRAFSQYVHGVSLGAIGKPLREHIEANLRNRDHKFGLEFPFLELGLYYRQVKRYLETFPASNVHIDFYEDYRDHPRETIASLLEFLNVDPAFVPDTSARHLQVGMPRFQESAHYLKATGLWQHARKLCPPSLLPLARRVANRSRKEVKMDPKDRAFLTGYYREDVLKLSDLLNRDLSGWLQ